MNIDDIADILAWSRMPLSLETETQAAIAVELNRFHCPWRREVALGPGSRVDFIAGEGVAIEVKLNAQQPRAILRQLGRYAAYAEVRSILLVTNRVINLPVRIGDKPARQMSLGVAWL